MAGHFRGTRLSLASGAWLTVQGAGCWKRTKEVGRLPGRLVEVIYPRTSHQGAFPRFAQPGRGLWLPLHIGCPRGAGARPAAENWISSHIYLPFQSWSPGKVLK